MMLSMSMKMMMVTMMMMETMMMRLTMMVGLTMMMGLTMMVIKRSVVARLADSVTGVTIPPNGAKLCRKYASHTALHKYTLDTACRALHLLMHDTLCHGAVKDSLAERLGRPERCEGCRKYSWKLLCFKRLCTGLWRRVSLLETKD